MTDALRVEHLSVRTETPYLLAIRQDLEPDPIGLLGGRIPDRNLGNMHRHLLGDDAALLADLRIRALMALHHVDAFHDELLIIEHPDHRTLAALVPAGEHDHLIAFTKLSHDCLTALPAPAR